jgi:hypothetical protein
VEQDDTSPNPAAARLQGNLALQEEAAMSEFPRRPEADKVPPPVAFTGPAQEPNAPKRRFRNKVATEPLPIEGEPPR